MLNKLNEQVSKCLERAEDCARKAAAQPKDSALKEDFLDLEKKWRTLARSVQLAEQLTDFTRETKRQRNALITPFLRDQAFDPETIEAMGQAFVTTCDKLGLTERDDALTELVARNIIEIAQCGLKNPTALHLAAMKAFKSDPQ